MVVVVTLQELEAAEVQLEQQVLQVRVQVQAEVVVHTEAVMAAVK